jgi:hypothetical protein
VTGAETVVVSEPPAAEGTAVTVATGLADAELAGALVTVLGELAGVAVDPASACPGWQAVNPRARTAAVRGSPILAASRPADVSFMMLSSHLRKKWH